MRGKRWFLRFGGGLSVRKFSCGFGASSALDSPPEDEDSTFKTVDTNSVNLHELPPFTEEKTEIPRLSNKKNPETRQGGATGSGEVGCRQ